MFSTGGLVWLNETTATTANPIVLRFLQIDTITANIMFLPLLFHSSPPFGIIIGIQWVTFATSFKLG